MEDHRLFPLSPYPAFVLCTARIQPKTQKSVLYTRVWPATLALMRERSDEDFEHFDLVGLLLELFRH